MHSLTDFWNIHKGKTALLVGNGPNLKKTPPEWFDYISFGMNTIYRYPNWRPDYYVGVDHSLWEHHADELNAAYPDILKFVPTPILDVLQGENYIRFRQRPGRLFVGGCLANNRDALERGIGYANVMTAAMQIAWHMGFTTLLLIGVEQKPDRGALREHFWGSDSDVPVYQNDSLWNIAYSQYVHSMTGVRVLNISQDTFVPEDILPRGDWHEWANAMPKKSASLPHCGAQPEPELRHDEVIYSGLANTISNFPETMEISSTTVTGLPSENITYTEKASKLVASVNIAEVEKEAPPVMSTKKKKGKKK